MKKTGNITEIFCSYQGEGIYVGQQQVFIRFAGCNLRCKYCDTVESQSADGSMKLTGDEVIDEIRSLLKNPVLSKKVKFVSLTGGEPLLQTNFLLDLIPKLKGNKLKVYLETNGTFPDKLKKIVGSVDIVAMDIKVLSDSGKNFWRQHKQFLKIAKKKVFVKLVLTKNTKDKEVYKSVSLIKSIDKNIPLVLQPVTANINVKPAKPEKIFRCFSYALQNLKNVFLIPQMQKYWQVR